MHFTKSAPKASRFFSTKVLDVYSTGPATHGTMAPWDNSFFLWPLHLMTSVVIEMRILQDRLLLCTVIEFIYLTISEKIMMTSSKNQTHDINTSEGVLRNGVPQSCSVWVSPRRSGGCSRARAASWNTSPRSFHQWWCTPDSSQCPLASKKLASLWLGHVFLMLSTAKISTHCASSNMGRIPKGVLPPTRSTMAWLSGKSNGSHWIPSLLAATANLEPQAFVKWFFTTTRPVSQRYFWLELGLNLEPLWKCYAPWVAAT